MSSIKKMLIGIFGEINYKAPTWLQKTNKKMLLLVVFLITGLVGSIFAYHHFNKDVFLQAQVSLNENIYILDGKGETVSQKASDLRINFSIDEASLKNSKIKGAQVFAALKLNNEVVKKGISASPDLGEGLWRWSGNSLVFSPANPWLPNKSYSLKLDKSLFNPMFKFKQKIEFSTAPLAAKIESLAIYSPPLNPKDKVLSATVVFNYPLAKQDLSKFIKLESKSKEIADLKLNFKQNSFGNKVFINSSKLKFTAKEAIARLEVKSGAKTLAGQQLELATISKNLAIPSVYSFFRIANLQTTIIKDEEDNPKQNLLLDFTDAVNTEQISAKISAYLLPKDRYWNKEELIRALSQKEQKQTGALDLKKLKKIELKLNPVANKYKKFVSFNFSQPQGGQILVKIPAGLKSISDFELGIDEISLLDIKPLPRQVKIQGKSWLALNNAYSAKGKDIVIKSLGVNQLKATLVKLDRNDLIQVLTQTRGDLSDLNFINYSFTENDLGDHHKLNTRVYQKNLAEPAYTRLNLAPYLANKNTGFFVVKAQGSVNNDWQTEAVKKLLVVTNLGLIAKDNADGTRKLFAHSLLTNDKVAGAKIRLLSRSGKEVFSTYTDAFGVAEVRDLKDLTGADSPAVYLVEKDGDLAFLPFNRWDRSLDLSNNSIGGLRSNYADKMRAFIFTDRGVYRPGETLKLGIAIKNGDFSKIRPQFVRLIIKDPEWNQILERKIKLDKSGIFDYSFKTELNQLTGNYSVSVIPMDSHMSLGEAYFRLEEFSPATMKLKTSLDLQKNAWLLPEDIKIDLDLKTLYGFAVANHKINGNYLVEETDFSFEKYPDFIFKNSVDENTSLQTKKRGKLEAVTTDKEGKATFEFSIDKLATGLYALLINSTTLDDTNTLSAKNLVLVSAFETILGFKTGINLKSIKKDEPVNLDLLLVNRKLEKITNENLEVKIYQKRKVSSLVKQENGNLAYQFIEEEKFIKKIPISLAKASKLNLPTQKSGDFIAKFENSTGALIAQIDFKILQEDGSGAESENLALSLNKRVYEVADKANINLNAPYAGLALITLEREKVLAYKWVQLKQGSQTLEFKLPPNVKGSAYVNVLLVRSLAEENKISEPLSYSVAEIFIKPSEHKINISLSSPKKIRAGDSLNISYATDQKAKLILYAVDEGILQVAKYQTPKPLEFFFAKRALEVRTQQMADLLMPGLSIMLGMPSGAGSDEMMFEKKEAALDGNFAKAKSLADSSLNPLLRQVKAPVAFWSGILTADKNPQNLKIKLPKSFTGKMRIMAFAANDTALGADSTNSLSIAPLILTSNGVNYLAKDDLAEFSISVRNGDLDEAKKDVELKLDANEFLEILDFKTQKFDLKGGEEKIFKFKVKAKNIGIANVKFSAKHKDYKIEEVRSISLRPSVKYALQLSLGLKQDKKIELKPHSPVEDTLAKTQVFAAGDISPILQGLNSYLQDFEHDCTEQLVSKIYPLITLNKNKLLKNKFVIKNSSSTDTQTEDYLTKYNKLLDILRARKNYDASFANWSNGAKGSDIVSLYVINFLLDAKDAGLDIKNLDANNKSFLHKLIKENKDAYEVAYSIYLLGRQKVNVFSYLADYKQEQDAKSDKWQQNLTGAYIAAAWKLVGNNEHTDFIADYDWSSRIYSPQNLQKINLAGINRHYISENAQYVYLVARHFPKFLAKIDSSKLEKLLLPLAQGRLNTLSAGFTSLAFNNLPELDFAKTKGTLKILAKGKEFKNGSSSVLVEANSFLADLAIENPAKKWVFYSHQTLGFAKNQDSISKGLEVSKTFFDLDGKVKNEFKQGDEILVKVKIRSTDNQVHENVVLTDMLPGGLTLRRENIVEQNSLDYFDLREDRINFYLAVGSEVTTLVYRAKAVVSGDFKVLPVYAHSMYESEVEARGSQSTIYIRSLD